MSNIRAVLGTVSREPGVRDVMEEVCAIKGIVEQPKHRVCVVLDFIDPRERKLINEASSYPGPGSCVFRN